MTPEQEETLLRETHETHSMLTQMRDRPRLGEDAGDDGAPEQVRQGVEGFDRVFGRKPRPGTKAYDDWYEQIPLTTKVYASVPAKYVDGVIELASRTGVKAVFVEHNGKMQVALTVEPNPWFTDPINFVGSNIEGLIRSVLDSEK